MIQIDIPKDQIQRLKQELGEKAKQLPTKIAKAVNDTAHKVHATAAGEVFQELMVTKTAIKKSITKGPRANKNHTGAKVIIEETKRLPLKDFKPNELKRGGVSYKISRGTKGKKKIRDAFIVHRYANHVYKRRGIPRGPLTLLKGVSPWGVYVKRNIDPKVRKIGEDELEKQMNRQIREVVKRREGVIK